MQPFFYTKCHLIKAEMHQTAKLLLFILSSFLFFNSCKKQAPVCTGNCATINADGRVVNKLNNTSAAGVPVSLSWVKFVGGFSQSEVILTVKSQSDGKFNFTSSIDTTYFTKRYFLSLSAGSNDEYIILGYSGLISTRTYSFDPNAFHGIQLEVYKKANLKIKLNRTQNDNFKSFSISHSNVVDDVFLYDYNISSPQEVIDRNESELNVKTVADVYTKIKVIKAFPNGTSTTTVDSVRCTANSTCVYEVSF
jgi:hypothetical protein